MTVKSNAERETIIRRAADEQEWEVFSEDPRVIRKLTKLLGAGSPRAHSDGFWWRLGPKGVRFSAPRTLDLAGSQKIVEQLARGRAQKHAAQVQAMVDGEDEAFG